MWAGCQVGLNSETRLTTGGECEPIRDGVGVSGVRAGLSSGDRRVDRGAASGRTGLTHAGECDPRRMIERMFGWVKQPVLSNVCSHGWGHGYPHTR